MLGTESSQVLVLNTAANAVSVTWQLQHVPAFMCASGKMLFAAPISLTTHMTGLGLHVCHACMVCFKHWEPCSECSQMWRCRWPSAVVTTLRHHLCTLDSTKLLVDCTCMQQHPSSLRQGSRQAVDNVALPLQTSLTSVLVCMAHMLFLLNKLA